MHFRKIFAVAIAIPIVHTTSPCTDPSIMPKTCSTTERIVDFLRFSSFCSLINIFPRNSFSYVLSFKPHLCIYPPILCMWCLQKSAVIDLFHPSGRESSCEVVGRKAKTKQASSICLSLKINYQLPKSVHELLYQFFTKSVQL